MSDLDRTNAASLKAEGNALYKAGRYLEALPKYTAAIDADGSDPTFYANRAAVLVQLHRHAEAVRDCERAVALKPGYTRAWVRLASAQQALGLFDAAANSFTRAAESSTSDSDKAENMAAARASAAHKATASVALATVAPYLRVRSAGTAAVDGRKAEEEEEEEEEEEGKSGHRNFTAVCRDLKALLTTASQSADLRLAYAKALHGCGRCETAAQASAAAMQLSPGSTQARYVLGWCRACQGRFLDAVSTWQEALRRDPDAAACLASLKHVKALVAAKQSGNTLYKAGSFEEASKVYAEAAALSRTFIPKGIAALYNNLAASHMAAGDHAAGLAACSAAIAAQPYSPKGYERRAKCHTALGDLEAAASDLQHAQWLSPASEALPHAAHAAQTSLRKAKSKPMSMVVHVNNEAEWRRVVSHAAGRLVVVDYFATWCGPCKQIAPVVDQMSLGYSHVLFVKIDSDQCKPLTQAANVRAFPTFKLYRDGAEVGKLEGADANTLLGLVRQHSLRSTTQLEELPGPPWQA